MTKSEYREYISSNNPGFIKTRESHLRVHYPEILEEVRNHIAKYNIQPVNFSDSMNYYLNDITVQVTCKVCSKNIHSTYQYCSNVCKKKDIQTILSRTHQTLFERNGSTSPLGSKAAMNKRKETCKKVYGVEHPSSNKVIRDKIQSSNIETYKDENVRKNLSNIMSKVCEERNDEIVAKRKQTNFINTGEYTTLTKSTIAKTKQTLKDLYSTTNTFAIHSDTYDKAKAGCLKFFDNEENVQKMMLRRNKTTLERYGVENVYQSEEIKEKIKETNLERYGVENVFQSEEIKEKIKKVFLEKYGVENPAQDKEIHERGVKNGFKINYFRDTDIWYQGSYELDFLNKYYDKYPDITRGPRIKYIFEDETHYYFPDFYIPSLNLIIEIKSLYILNKNKEQVETKEQYTIKKGFNYVIIIDKNYDGVDMDL